MSVGGPFDAVPGTAVPRPEDAAAGFEAALNMALGWLEVGVTDVRLVHGMQLFERVQLSTAISLRRIADALEASNEHFRAVRASAIPPVDGDGDYRGR